MGAYQSSNHRTDEQLEAILSETGDWAVNGTLGQVLCLAASFRRALERAAEYAASGAVVTTICRLPSASIVVDQKQIARLREVIAVREIMPEAGHGNLAAWPRAARRTPHHGSSSVA